MCPIAGTGGLGGRPVHLGCLTSLTDSSSEPMAKAVSVALWHTEIMQMYFGVWPGSKHSLQGPTVPTETWDACKEGFMCSQLHIYPQLQCWASAMDANDQAMGGTGI